MSNEELIKTIKQFNVERVENLDDGAKGVFYAIMRIADERDELLKKVKVLNEQNDNNIIRILAVNQALLNAILMKLGYTEKEVMKLTTHVYNVYDSQNSDKKR